MELKNELHKAGLNKQECVVYLYLMEIGLSSPPQIAKGAGLLRPNTYNVLRTLQEKGLVERSHKGKRFLYHAKDPHALVLRLEEQKESISSLIPDLSALYKSQKNKPTIKFYYGLEEVKQLFGHIDAEEILFIASTDKIFETYPKFFSELRKKAVQEQVFVRDILTQQSGHGIERKTKELMGAYYEARYLPKQFGDVPTSIRLWNDNIALVSFDEPVFATVITNRALSKTFRTMFEVMWNQAEKM